MDTDKSQDLQGELASWRPRRIDGVSSLPKAGRFESTGEPIFYFKFEGIEKKKNENKQTNKKTCYSSKAGRQEKLPLFRGESAVTSKSSTDWMMPIHMRQGNGLYSVY